MTKFVPIYIQFTQTQMKLDKNITGIGTPEQLPILWYLFKWTIIGAVAGALIGSASALLLASLNWATDYRENNLWIWL